MDKSAAGWRLYKSSVAVKSHDTSSWESFLATTFICAQLLALIESQGIRRFVLHSGPTVTTGAFLVKLDLLKVRNIHANKNVALGIQSQPIVFEF